jgi:pyruvate,orthophosphate dikinase
VHDELLTVAATLEREGRDVQDIEYTVESGRLYLLQTRAAKRSPDAAIRFAVALHEEGLLTQEEALASISPPAFAALLRPHIDPVARLGAAVLASGEPACPGVGSGLVVTDCVDAEDRTDMGEEVVLARSTTDPNDVSGMIVATAVVTEVGGATSHAAVVSRELGTPCVVGCGSGTVATLNGRVVTVDGSSGEVFDGALPLVEVTEHDNPDLARVAAWARRRVPHVSGPLPEILIAAQQSAALADATTSQ